MSGFVTVDHDLHRSRRAPISKFFSRSSISRLEGEISGLVQRLCDKLLAQKGQKQPFDITIAYSNFSTDAISSYCFGENFGRKQLSGSFHNPSSPYLDITPYKLTSMEHCKAT